MIKLPAPRLLPITIVATAILLGLKSVSLGQAALASDQSEGMAFRTPPTIVPQRAMPSELSRAPRTTDPAIAPASVPTSDGSDWPLLQDLRSRRKALEQREHALDLRQAAIEAAARTLQTRLADLRSLQAQLASLQAARQQRSEAGWTGIVKVYEAMKPTDAAAIFDALDPRLLVQILDRMNERKAALVMGGMAPERARLATQMLANFRQHQNGPVELAVPDDLSRSGNG